MVVSTPIRAQREVAPGMGDSPCETRAAFGRDGNPGPKAPPDIPLTPEARYPSPETPMPETDACRCRCHADPAVRHEWACCLACGHCGVRIEVERWAAHTRHCRDLRSLVVTVSTHGVEIVP